jgi:hypothetical protein
MDTNSQPQIERRKHKRYLPLGDAFVVLTPSDIAMGRILDISMDGLTFEYFICDGPPIQPRTLEILTADRSFHLNNIPCRAIWDVTTYESPLISVKRKRCAVQFGELKEVEKAHLLYFIKEYTRAAS